MAFHLMPQTHRQIRNFFANELDFSWHFRRQSSAARNLLGELLRTQRIKQEIATAETEP
jgi:hypothetical protein